jgi:hypothetical protein
MGHLEGRLRKAQERAESLHEELTLPSGRIVRIAQGDCFAAVISLLEHGGEDLPEDLEPLHWLAREILKEAGDKIPDLADPTSGDFVQIVCALASPKERIRK